MSEPAGVEATDESVLAAFRDARRVEHRRPLRRAAVIAATIFAGVSLIAIATHSDDLDAGDLDLAGGELVPVDPSAPPGAGAAADGSAPGAGADGDGSLGYAGAGSAGTDGTDATPPALATGEAPPGDAPGLSPTAPAEEPPDVAVVSPALKVFAFGSTVGMPLLCSVSASAVIGQIQDPTLAEVATTVVTSCIEFGTQGGEALEALNGQLAQLEAVNPAAGPVIDALADVFNSAGSEAAGLPFAEALFTLGEFVRFFSPS